MSIPIAPLQLEYRHVRLRRMTRGDAAAVRAVAADGELWNLPFTRIAGSSRFGRIDGPNRSLEIGQIWLHERIRPRKPTSVRFSSIDSEWPTVKSTLEATLAWPWESRLEGTPAHLDASA